MNCRGIVAMMMNKARLNNQKPNSILVSSMLSPLSAEYFGINATIPVSRAGSNGRCNTHRIGSIHNAFEEGPTCRGDLQLDLKQGSPPAPGTASHQVGRSIRLNPGETQNGEGRTVALTEACY